LESVLPDGFVLEWCPAAGEWWRQAAAALRQGHLLTFDYGFTAREFLAPERPHGTLRAYRRHHVTAELLESPGEQDLTAHVNFTQLERAGQDQGLATEGLFTQAQFLTQAARRLWRESSHGEPSPLEARQFQTLTHPEHLGRSFRVLVQRRAEGRS
jgi:SAM-dependent MidA family methyltransferase